MDESDEKVLFLNFLTCLDEDLIADACEYFDSKLMFKCPMLWPMFNV